MPFSMLGQSSKVAAGNIVRPSRPSGNFYTTGIAQTPRNFSTRHSDAVAASNTHSLQTQRYPQNRIHRLCPKPVTAQGASYITTRRRSTIAELFHGNEEYMANMSKDNPGLLASLANEGQRPPFMLVDCSDSRVNEQGIFTAQPGTIFTAGNIANRFDEDDPNSNAVLSFAVETLKVKHVVVMGHYGCGGVAAAMMPLKDHPRRPADIAVQGWISPIRHIYDTSKREEIAAHRRKHKNHHLTSEPRLHDPAFRALVEENVKSNVLKIANSAVVREIFAAAARPPTSLSSSTDAQTYQNNTLLREIYIHGWVYDVENGKVSDLKVSVGPPGCDLPFSPFPVIPASIECSSYSHRKSC